jgi:hypothetical protein
VPAAATLVLIYAFGVVSCLAVLAGLFTVLRMEDTPPSIGDFLEVVVWLAPPAAVAFVLLAAARRAGFIALWVLLAGLWTFMAESSVPRLVPPMFLGWTVIAVPLWVIGQLGFVRPAPRGRFSLSLGAILGIWIALAFAGSLLFAPAGIGVRPESLLPYRAATLAAWVVWLPAPFFLSAVAIHHVWRGTASTSVAMER